MAKRSLLEWMAAIFLALCVCLGLFTFSGEFFFVKNNSMQPSLTKGDLVWVKKWNINHQLNLNPITQKILYQQTPSKPYDWKYDDIMVFKNDSQNNQIMRVVGLPGDSIKVRKRKVWINGKLQKRHYPILVQYRVSFKNAHAQKRICESLIQNAPSQLGNSTFWTFQLRDSTYLKLQKDTGVALIQPMFQLASDSDENAWPNWSKYGWNTDNLGPIYIPKKGEPLLLNSKNVTMYAKLIAQNEHNFVRIGKQGNAFVNGIEKTHYVFQKNYVFVLGDNRHKAIDSRYLGPICTENALGKAEYILFGTFAIQNGVFAINKNHIWKKL